MSWIVALSGGVFRGLGFLVLCIVTGVAILFALPFKSRQPFAEALMAKLYPSPAIAEPAEKKIGKKKTVSGQVRALPAKSKDT